ncbi:hypothetical protein [Dokdonia sinensis]|nr:hypothetical protein [Dokdonia sinensis]
MKKLSYLTFFIAVFTASFFTSCENEPVTGEFFTTPDGTDGTDDGEVQTEECATNFDLLATAQAAFATADEESYTEACIAYATLLDFLILECGDADGSLQNTLNSLGDCSAPNLCLQAIARTEAARITFENADEESQQAACFAYLVALEAQIEVCGDAGGVAQAIIDGLPCDNDCENATAATTQAQEVFAMVDPLDENAYVQACNTYKTLLEAQIAACGDPDGTLLETIQSLGECTPPEEPGPLQMTINGEFKNFNTLQVTSTSGTTQNILARDEDTGDTFFFRAVVLQTGENTIQDELLVLDGVEYTPVVEGMAYSSNLVFNVDNRFRGFFSGLMRDGEGNEITITNGRIDNVAPIVALRFNGAINAFNDVSVTTVDTDREYVATATNGDTFEFKIAIDAVGDNVIEEAKLTVGGTEYDAGASVTSNIAVNSGTVLLGNIKGRFANGGSEINVVLGLIDLE